MVADAEWVAGIKLTGSSAAGDDVPARPPDLATREASEFFESRIRPILVERCIGCHGPKKQSSGLRLDSREAVLKGGDSGPAVVPGNLEESLLVAAIGYTDEVLKMPPSKKLAKERDCQTITGVDMFVLQAAHQFKLYTGRDAPLDVMRAVVARKLGPIRE